MNERMIELYRQAHVPSTMIDPSNNMPVPSTCFSADKFAELIVRECITKMYSRGVEGFGILEERMLTEHFGVEE